MRESFKTQNNIIRMNESATHTTKYSQNMMLTDIQRIDIPIKRDAETSLDHAIGKPLSRVLMLNLTNGRG